MSYSGYNASIIRSNAIKNIKNVAEQVILEILFDVL